MLTHCRKALSMSLGLEPYKKPGFMIRLFAPMIKKTVLGPNPYKQNLPTNPDFIVADAREFKTEKEALLKAMNCFFSVDPKKINELKHPIFGKLTVSEWDWAMYKHLDHHLTQFGV